MKLNDYFFKKRITAVEFANQHKISKTAIYRFIKGGRPSFTMCRKIEQITEGEVTVEDLLNKKKVRKDI